MKRFLIFLICAFSLNALYSQNSGSEMSSLSQIKKNVKTKRVGSFDQTGGNGDCLSGIVNGEKRVIMDVKGAGIINHIWITIAPEAAKASRNDIILRIYWDGNTFPSVESPIGPFFGNGWNETYNFVTTPLSVSPGWGKSYVSYFAMPFAIGAKIEIENQTGEKINSFYFNIDYTEMEALPENTGRFHAWYNHEITDALQDGENEWGLLGETGKNPKGEGNYVFADIQGKGHFVGVNYYVNCPSTMWYGEGDEMVFIDGDEKPTLNGTGTEDFFNTSWCPKELFQHPYYGELTMKQAGWGIPTFTVSLLPIRYISTNHASLLSNTGTTTT
jgi:hypothetical protein